MDLLKVTGWLASLLTWGLAEYLVAKIIGKKVASILAYHVMKLTARIFTKFKL